MNTKRFYLVLFLMAIVAMSVWVKLYTDNQKRAADREEHQAIQQIKDRSHKNFVSNSNRAKQNTKDPCFLPFFEWVRPEWAGEDSEKPKLFMMGEEVEYVNPGPVGFTYWLEPKGKKVEL